MSDLIRWLGDNQIDASIGEPGFHKDAFIIYLDALPPDPESPT